MTIWIFSAIAALAVTLWLGRPLVRAQGGDDAGAGWKHDIAVYRDQLTELDNEQARGLIAEGEAKTARAEIARRLLKAEEARERQEQASVRKIGRPAGAVALLCVPVFALGTYALTGSPDLPAQPLQARLAEQRVERAQVREREAQMQTMVAQVETHLAANPNDGQGWDVLAPIYLRNGQAEKAVNAYERAVELIEQPSAKRLAGLGEARFAAAQGVITAQARAAFEEARRIEPDNARARFYLGFADAQQGAFDTAEIAWVALANDESADRNWRSAAIEGLDRLKNDPASLRPVAVPDNLRASAAPQLDQSAIEGAADMSPEERRAMIMSMVDGLDAQLRDDPDNVAGWQRLLRSRMALGDFEAAADALQRSQDALSGQPEKAQAVADFADELGVTARLATPPAGGETQ